jgi:hypothetical protein
MWFWNDVMKRFWRSKDNVRSRKRFRRSDFDEVTVEMRDEAIPTKWFWIEKWFWCEMNCDSGTRSDSEILRFWIEKQLWRDRSRFWREAILERTRFWEMKFFQFWLFRDDFELLKINFNLLNTVISNGVRKIK